MSQRFAVEINRRTVGIAVRVPGGFMFYASNDDFDEMDGRLFRRARVIERELRRLAKRARRADRLAGHAGGAHLSSHDRQRGEFAR